MKDKIAEIPDLLQAMRERAKRRKSPWNLLLLAFFIVIYAGILYVLLTSAFFMSVLGPDSQRAEGTKILFVLPWIIGLLPLTMLMTNLLAFKVTPLRRALDRETAGIPESSYMNSQKLLTKIVAITLPAVIFLSYAIYRWLP